jgi:hypothetical protein
VSHRRKRASTQVFLQLNGSGWASWVDPRLHTVPDQEYLLDLSSALFQELAAQESVNDFRRPHMDAEDYLVREET